MKNTDQECDNGFIPQKNILNNLSQMAMILKQSDQQLNRNSSKSNINAAGEMFVYLNACPSFYVRLYQKAIFGPKSRIAMLALNIIKEANDGFEVKATEIFAKMSQVLGFQHISHQNKGNESFEMKAINLDINVTDKKLLQTVSNHPVHILNDDGQFSPSSFIPFCSFGEDYIGSKVNKFEIPVCNIFEPKIYHDQLCYETDLQKFKGNNNQMLENQLAMGLTLVLDHNEERQLNYNVFGKNTFSIYLDTISINSYNRRILKDLSF